MAAFGDWTLTIDPEVVDGTDIPYTVTITPNPSPLRDQAGNKLYTKLHNPQTKYTGLRSFTLKSDSVTGDSTTVSYRVQVSTKLGVLVDTEFYAPQIGSTASLADLAQQVVVPLTSDGVSQVDFNAYKGAASGTFATTVVHGTNALLARPSNAGFVLWVGSVLPVNMQGTDLFINLDVSAPTVPTNLTARMSGSSVVLSWTAATDDVGVSGYNVHRSATSGFTTGAGTLLGTASGTTYTDAAPLSGPAYYKVTAKDGAGNESAASLQVAPFNPLGIGISWHAAVWAELDTAANGATMSTITDRSGNSRTFSAYAGDTTRAPLMVTAAAALNGHKAFSFDGVNDAVETATFTNVAQPWTFVLIGERTRNGASATALLSAYGFDVDSAANTSGAVQSGTNSIHNMNDGTDLAGGTDDKFIMVGKFQGATSTIQVNSTSASGSTGTGAHNAARWMIGSKVSANWYGNVRVAFAGFVAGTLTANQITALTDGAKQFYALP